jgi:hypothetical protein
MVHDLEAPDIRTEEHVSESPEIGTTAATEDQILTGKKLAIIFVAMQVLSPIHSGVRN